MPTKNESNEIKLTRIYDASIKTVWDAWNDPVQAAHWWGPRGFTITTHSKDFKAGGHWSYTMHGPDGKDWPNTTHYLEIEQYSRMVYDHGGAEGQPPLFRVTVLFTDLKGKTRIDMTMALATAEAAENTRKFIKKAGGESTWDRLAEYLIKEATGKEQFVINRSFDASLEQMYEMWTKPEHFSQWLAPTGFTMKFVKADIRSGGDTLWMMTNGGTMTMYGRAHYLELTKPDRIVYTQQFCDEQGNIARHPMAPTWPETMRTTVILTAEGPRRTRVTVTWEPYGAFTTEELATFVSAKAGMTQGWTGSFDKLEAHFEGAGVEGVVQR